MKRWLAISFVLVASLMIISDYSMSEEEERIDPEQVETSAGYQTMKLRDRSLDDVEVDDFCLQLGHGIMGCRVKDSDNEWAVRYQWIRFQDDPTKLISGPDFLRMEMDGKIKPGREYLQAFYTRSMSAKSNESARKEAIKSKYWNPPSALVDSVYNEVEKITGGIEKGSVGEVKVIRPN